MVTHKEMSVKAEEKGWKQDFLLYCFSFGDD